MIPSSDQAPAHDVPSAVPPGRRRWGVTILWVTPLLFLGAIFVYGTLARLATDTHEWEPRVGQPMADFTFPDLQGQDVQLSSLRGKVVFINVWATWCPPCIEEMPTIQQLHDRYQARGLEILAISIDALGAQIVKPFVQQHRLTFPILLDPKGHIERLYRTTGVPESFIIDKQGLLVEKIIGPRDWMHPRMLALFERLFKAPGPGVDVKG